MAKKIKIDGNFLTVTDTVSGLIDSPQPIPAKEMTYNEAKLRTGIIQFETTRFLSNSTEFELYPPFPLANAVNSGDVAFTESTFREFCLQNLGKSSPESGAEFVKTITKLSDLPTPISGVTTLEDELTYDFVTSIDLLGSRLVGGENTTILGKSSENCSITSTGLGAGIPLFTSIWTTPIRNITFRNVDTLFDLDGDGNNMALDWTGVNYTNIPNWGTVKNFTNFISSKCAFLNSKGLKIDGTFGTFSIDNSLLLGDGSAGSIVEVLPTATSNTRVRIVYSSVVAFGSTVGLNVSNSATISNESYILDTVNFSGGGTYLSGLNDASNKSLFVNCNGVTNTFVNGQLYMQNNATVTTISVAGTFTKVLGTTTPSVDNSKFSHSNNRLTCEAAIDRKYLIQCNLSFTTTNNKECEFGFYDSKLGEVRTPSKTKSTSNSGGRGENISFNCVVDYIQGNYLEIWVTNNTNTDNVTVTDLNFVITEIG